MLDDDQREPDPVDERRRVVRRQFYYALFYLGTLLAVIGWYIDIRGVGEYSRFLDHLTIVALVGHLLQVVAAYALLITPDSTNETDD